MHDCRALGMESILSASFELVCRTISVPLQAVLNKEQRDKAVYNNMLSLTSSTGTRHYTTLAPSSKSHLLQNGSDTAPF